MRTRVKQSIAILITAMMVLATAFQSFAAPLSYAKPAAAEAGTEKVAGTWSKDAAGNWSFNSQDGAAKDGWYYLNTTNKGTDYNWFYFTNGVMNSGWVQDKNDPSVWYYAGETKDSSEGGMVKGWVTDPRDGKKYYMDPSTGIMCYGWKQLNGLWYYFGEPQYANATHPFGAMYVNEKTPDGYYVGASGIWGQTTNSGSSNRKPTPVTTYTVTFNMNGHGEQISSLTGLKSGSRITAPTAPTADGFAFGGWYKEAACTNAWDFSTDTVTKNVTLYAKWVEGITIAEILNKVSGGFPKEQNAWVADSGYRCFINDISSELRFRDTSGYGYDIGVSELVTKDGDNYVYEANWGKIFFTMDSDSLISITWYSNLYDDYNGTYKAPATTPTFKAVYDTNADANTLTFYYDTLDHSGTNITVYNNLPTAATGATDWGYDGIRSSVKSVVIDSSVANYKGLTSTAYMFYAMRNAENITGAEYLDVSNVTDMSKMFNSYGAISTALNTVPNVSQWNTGEVTNMTSMFSDYGCFSKALTGAPDVSGWNTANVTDMSNMFNQYGKESTALKFVPDVSQWNTESATNMYNLFNEYGLLSTVLDFTLDLSKWSVAKVTGNRAYTNLFQNAGNNATTWSVTIPAKTGEQANEPTKWYVGDGTSTTKYIEPNRNKQFTLATPAPTISNIADVLATVEDFPTSDNGRSVPNDAWTAANGNKCHCTTNDLCFNIQPIGCKGIGLNENVEESGSDYNCNGNGLTVTFHMTKNVLTSITVEGIEEYNGTYRAPVSLMSFLKSASKPAITIGSVIEDYLPTLASPDDAVYEAWKSGDSKWCYNYNNSLCFKDSNGSISINLDEPAVEDIPEILDEDEIIYKYENDDYVITFYTAGEALVSVTFESKGDSFRYYDGVYIAQEPIPEESEMEETKEDIESDDGKAIQDEETEKKNAEPESEISEIAAEVKKEEQSQPLASKEETDQETE